MKIYNLLFGLIFLVSMLHADLVYDKAQVGKAEITNIDIPTIYTCGGSTSYQEMVINVSIKNIGEASDTFHVTFQDPPIILRQPEVIISLSPNEQGTVPALVFIRCDADAGVIKSFEANVCSKGSQFEAGKCNEYSKQYVLIEAIKSSPCAVSIIVLLFGFLVFRRK